ncbi:MAG TPA: DUF4142 domain-containing protein [Vicinamibacterales bacterium]|jgi:putative membrane protein
MKRIGVVPIALAVALTIGCDRNDRARNADGSPAIGTSGKSAENVSRGDKDFVNDLVIANMAEIELGRLAVEKAASADVKKFAQQMIDDHTAAQDKLKRIASPYKIETPTELDGKHRDLRDDLSKKQGADFDKAYIDAMVSGHDDVLDKVGSRIDKQRLGDWRTKMEDRMAGRKVEERAQAEAIVAEPSDNPFTFELNKWAADSYPTIYHHHAQAKDIQDAVKRRTTN